MDVKLAFFHQTKGYIYDPSLFFKLKKSLYGLKRAPREWYSKMDAFSRKTSKDVNQIQMYIYRSMMVILLSLFYILMTGSTVASISVIKIALHDAFEMSDLGLLKQFLGLEIAQNYDGIMVT